MTPAEQKKKKEKAERNAELLKSGLPVEQKTLREIYEDAEQKSEARYMIVQAILKKFSVLTLGEKIRETYVYDYGMFIPGEVTIVTEVQSILQSLASKGAKSEIMSSIRDMTSAKRSLDGAPRNLINFANGVYDISQGTLLPHDPSYRFFHRLPVAYDKDATCPTIQKFFEDVLQPDQIPVIEEWFGYCLYRDYFIKKALILTGERDTGKSTLLKLLASLIGRENIAGVALQRLSSDKFAASSFVEKHVNIYDDLSSRDIGDNGAFKIATGNGIITGEHKFGEQFQFVNYAKLTFACNAVPDVKENEDDAYFSRWIVIEFEKHVEHPDKFLFEKLTTPQELSGLLNLALRGLARILSAQSFSYQREPEDIKRQMMSSGPSIAKFASAMLLPASNDSHISKEDMYAHYVAYCQDCHIAAETMDKLGKNLKRYASYILDATALNIFTRKQERVWRNVEIAKSEQETLEPAQQTLDDLFPDQK